MKLQFSRVHLLFAWASPIPLQEKYLQSQMKQAESHGPKIYRVFLREKSILSRPKMTLNVRTFLCHFITHAATYSDTSRKWVSHDPCSNSCFGLSLVFQISGNSFLKLLLCVLPLFRLFCFLLFSLLLRLISWVISCLNSVFFSLSSQNNKKQSRHWKKRENQNEVRQLLIS